jgi:hypothetical protein
LGTPSALGTSAEIVPGLFDKLKKIDTSDKLLADISSAYPQAQLQQLGTSVNGKPINALKVSTAGGAYRPSVFVNCAHHSNELITPEYCFQIINDLLGTPEGHNSIGYFDFWIVPFVNVDKVSRTNANGVNLNRNYAFKWSEPSAKTSANPSSGNYKGPSPFSEPETAAIRDLFNKIHFTFAISVHATSTKIVYGYTSPNTVDPNPHFQKAFAKVMQTNAKLRLSSGGKYKLRKMVYPVSGADQDWYQAEHGSIAILVEAPSYSGYADARDVVKGYMPGFWATLEHYKSLPKLRVKVVNSAGAPVIAKVMAQELIYSNGEEFHTDPIHGVREIVFLQPGTYNIDVEKSGTTKTFSVAVGPGVQDHLVTFT